MLIDEMFEQIIIRSGQFLLGSAKVELNRDRFVTLVRSALGTYSRYSPADLTFNLKMQTNRSYTFTKTFRPDGKDDDWGVPKFISSVTPTAIIGSPAFSLMGQFGSKLGWSNSMGQSGNNSGKYALPGQTQMASEQMEKSQFPWVWRSPKLYIPYSADVEVVAAWNHQVFEVPANESEGGQTTYRVDTIDYSNDVFFDLLEGMFLKALGQSRRAFTMSDLPIVSDADTIASDGKALMESAIQDLTTNKSKFYLAYGD